MVPVYFPKNWIINKYLDKAAFTINILYNDIIKAYAINLSHNHFLMKKTNSIASDTYNSSFKCENTRFTTVLLSH